MIRVVLKDMDFCPKEYEIPRFEQIRNEFDQIRYIPVKNDKKCEVCLDLATKKAISGYKLFQDLCRY